MDTIGICFGRYNPPHKGHRESWKIAAQSDQFFIGTNPNTIGPKDPLPFDVKLKVMETILPNVADHIIPEQNLFTLASKIYETFGEHIQLKVCTDEDWLANSLEKYNGIESTHGYFKFDSIIQKETPRLSSATTLRDAVKTGDKELFTKAAGISADTEISINNRVFKFFDLVEEFIR